MSIKTRTIKRVIDGVPFTFTCRRSSYNEMFSDAVHFSFTWVWGADSLSGNRMAKGSSRTMSVRTGIKYQVQAAKMKQNQRLA